MKGAVFVWGLGLSLAGAAAGAQTPPVAQTESLPAPPPDDASERAVLDEASAALVADRPREAQRRLDAALTARRLSRDGNTGLATLARLSDQLLARDGAAPAREANPRSALGAVTLYGSLVGYGLGTGVFADLRLGITDLRAAAWLPLVGAGAGLAGALLLDRPHPVSPSLTASLNTGLVLGTLAGGGLALQLQRHVDGFDTADAATAVWAGATVGLGLGVGLHAALHPSPGSASFVQSGGAWGGALGLLTGLALQRDAHLGLALGVGELLGAGAAAFATHALRPTPGRVHWMDLGALGGALVGTAISLLLLYEADQRPAALATVELCTLGGGVAGYLFGARREPPSHDREARGGPSPAFGLSGLRW